MTIVDEWGEDAPPASSGQDPQPKSKKGGKKSKKKKEEPPPLYYKTLEEFVIDFLGPVIRRQISNTTQLWCPKWWLHPEALSRLAALWRAWEHLRNEPALGMSTWWLHHADPHMRALMHPDLGPFAMCSPEKGHSAFAFPALPTAPADPAMWLSPAFSAAPADPPTAQ
ncbi:DUF4913 domain-containing protein [Streptomyces chryseus]|uniref:DUF4913 domain-containing protein n=1 Tax=Streptomyces chryseus TaxID=68186 RepID=UPI00110FBAE5|nr:DUF4913 domain-containing protein [Streptomyces chryseus]GGX36585.1 hypothetical protein GCM10010353_59620 [Streptomyces chryseus]